MDVAEKINRQWRSLDEVFQMKLKKFDPGVTCDVTGQVKHKMFEISIEYLSSATCREYTHKQPMNRHDSGM